MRVGVGVGIGVRLGVVVRGERVRVMVGVGVEGLASGPAGMSICEISSYVHVCVHVHAHVQSHVNTYMHMYMWARLHEHLRDLIERLAKPVQALANDRHSSAAPQRPSTCKIVSR